MSISRKEILPFLISLTCFTGIDSLSQQLPDKTKPDQYRAIHWTMEEGLPQAGNHTMIKDAKGFLWIGSFLEGYGFCRFDGATFKKYLPDSSDRNTINSDNIFSFREDSLNNIWIGTAKGLSRYDFKADTFTNFVSHVDPKLSDKSIVPFWSTKDELYCVESGTYIVVYNIHSLKIEKRLSLQGLNEIQIRYILLDTLEKSLWILNFDRDIGKQSLVQFTLDDGKSLKYSWSCYRNIPDHWHGTEAMQYDPKRNCIWINSPDGLLEFSLKDKQFHLPNAFRELIKSKDYDRFVGIDLDKKGRVWLATLTKGILIYDPETEQLNPVFSDQDWQKKVGEVNLKIYCDRDGIVWTSNWQSFGIYEILPFDRSDKRYAAKPGVQDSLSNGFVITIVQGAQNKMWIGTLDGINIFDPITEKFEVLREEDLPGIKGKGIAPVYIDTLRQKAWLFAGPGIDRGDHFNFYQLMNMYEMDIQTRQCKQIRFRDGTKLIDKSFIDPVQVRAYKNDILISADAAGVFEIKEGSLFADLVIPLPINLGYNGLVLTDERQMFLKPYATLPNFSFENTNGKWIKMPHMLDDLDWWFIVHNEKDHTYWVSFKYKLVHYDKDFREIRTYNEGDGYSGLAYKMILDNKNNLWFTNILEQVGRLNVTTGIITMLSETDGYHKKNYDWSVPLTRDITGNIYFGTGLSKSNEGLDRIYPEKYFSAVTSSVYLRSLTINQKPFPLSIGVNNLEKLSLRYNQNLISIETGVIDYYAQGKGHIRYKLEENGKDVNWQYGPAYYTIRYEGMRPGSYRLVMQASNNGNEFNSPLKILMIHISPPFWETWWFRTGVVIILLLLMYAIYLWRTATLRKQKRVLEQTVKVRTAEVVEEKAEVERQKEKSDVLLLNILPSEVAEELKEKGYTTAKGFDDVTVLFSDIKGFTQVAENMTAQELVKEINTYFSAFDGIIQKHGLEKIKTIGDAYIAAGGLPEKNSATAQDVVEAAIAMQQAVEKLKQERVSFNKPHFELRIGIHTGPVVAGVVGIKKFQYDIWGDTVNLAARMEQSGMAGKINISQHTYEAVKEQFKCIHRGKIEAKNKGEIDMYFVEQGGK